ncbi:peptidyl-Lys metalloendopeptidase [Chitinophaga costaii]|uniref:Peptidyl-Lys metalloendopeptidase n=1 Tax=Chitinophaga costaii TaxID=1335309 RepID=A0A1C4EFQ5_9BACT|nr:hypothetical protein [Chitinophaga costaii]PUZ23859.1 protease [Chitinophaga costaii]SCC42312.1 peptidyl-Lys metalloendopeptidase [Chitinophaga costaii]
MIRHFLVLAATCITAYTLPACKTIQPLPAGNDLVTVITMPSTIKTGGPVMLTFTVTNPSNKELKFLKWETPFEGFRNDCFDILNNAGELLPYHGIMAKRVMPPPADAYITVAPGQSTSASIDLATGYRITLPGDYSVEYTASNMSGLKKVNKISFTVVQ